MASSAVAEFHKVSKVYPSGWLGRGALRAVWEVTFRVNAGEVFGLLGPNRAGKTTLVKLLLSLCRPSSGQIVRLGQSASNRHTLGRVGYMHENHAFPRYLTAAALLHYYGALSGVPPELVSDRVPKLLEKVGLHDRSREPIARFSKGMVQRLGLAQALINDPELLVLDEPTEGLDLEGRQLLRHVILEQKRRGRTVLLISHVLTEVEQLADRMAVVVEGKLVSTGPLPRAGQDPARSLEQTLKDLYARANS